MIAPALFAGGYHHALPVGLPFFCTLTRQPHHAALGKQRLYHNCSQLHHFLDRVIHALAAGYRLRQCNPQRRFAVFAPTILYLHTDRSPRTLCNHGVINHAAAIEQLQRVAGGKSQHPHHMMRLCGRQIAPPVVRDGF